MNEHMNYRRATLADVDQLKRLALLAYGQYASVLGEDQWAMMKNNLANETLYAQLLKQSAGFICEQDNKLVGMVFLVPHGNPTAYFDEDWAYIRLLGVDPDYEGRGIGRNSRSNASASQRTAEKKQ